MKVNKLILRGLALGFLLNSASILSYANVEIPNRYQTLEGEYITIDDSTAGNLEEIEIFGNTVQDPNNLEDIQSVGDLYVNEKGEPILDNQGREQYKIEIISNNKNLFNLEDITPNIIDYTGATLDWDNYNCRMLIKTQHWQGFKIGNLNKQKTYTISYMINSSETIADCISNRIRWYDENGNSMQIRANNNTGSRIIRTINGVSEFYIEAISIQNVENIIDIFDIQLEEGSSATKYTPVEQQKTTILLPSQLQKVGTIADRLYWSNDKARYIIEDKVGFIDNNTFITNASFASPNETRIFITEIWNTLDTLLPSKHYRKTQLYSNENNALFTSASDFGYNTLYLYYNKEKLIDLGYEQTVSSISKAIKDFSLTCFYQKYLIKEIETNITSKLKIPTYDEKTHIYVNSENGINPTLKVTVDRIEQASQEAVNIVLSNPTTYNISLARMLVNQLSESLYKDQLQEQLNNIFSSEVVLEKKNATANLDLYIKSENILQMSLDTNSITFEDFSSVEDMTKENAVSISINSSLPYSLNAYLPTEIQNSDKSVTMDKTILNIKENSEVAYQTFSNINEKLILKDNCIAGNNINHGIDIKLKGNIAHQKDVYKTTIKFEAQQK